MISTLPRWEIYCILFWYTVILRTMNYCTGIFVFFYILPHTRALILMHKSIYEGATEKSVIRRWGSCQLGKRTILIMHVSISLSR